MSKVTRLFTFGFGQAFANCFVSITAPTAEECRQVMFHTFGKRWSMEYEVNKANDLIDHGMQKIATIEASDGQMITHFHITPSVVKGSYRAE